MKLIIDIPEKDFDFIKKTYKPTGYDFVARPLTNEIISSVMNATPFDSVIEDILKDLEYELYAELCKQIHKDEKCPCTNQTTSCLAKFRVCDADSAIGRVIDKHINKKED